MDIEIINEQYIIIKCIEAIQPIGSMYVGVINSDDLEKISYADVRRMELGIDNREVEDYIGIQRELNPKREREIGKYVNLIDATFPNSIILSIASEHVNYSRHDGSLQILYNENIAKVLDGQHRIAGLRHFNGSGNRFQCIVTIYIDMDLEDQALVFATINKEQKSVSNSLVADLFAFAESRSPQKTAHNIARALDSKAGSPFEGKIKILGTAVNKEKETITQDTFVKALIQYISKEPQDDRDFYKRNKKKNAKLPLATGSDLRRYFLRNIFIEDETDVKIAQLIWNYFGAIRLRWPNAWNQAQGNNILNKSTGFVALMRFFKDAYLSFEQIGTIITKEQFLDIFSRIDIEETDFNKETYIPGSSGIGQLYRDFLSKSGLRVDSSNENTI